MQSYWRKRPLLPLQFTKVTAVKIEEDGFCSLAKSSAQALSLLGSQDPQHFLASRLWIKVAPSKCSELNKLNDDFLYQYRASALQNLQISPNVNIPPS